MGILNQLLQGSIFFLALLLTALLLMPLEKFFPRIAEHYPLRRRATSILLIALLGLAVSLAVQFWLQNGAIAAFLKLRLFALSKAAMPDWLMVIAAFLLLDLASWLSHWLSHRFQLLWRLHAVHHADEHVTALSGLLHHPLETLFVWIFMLMVAVITGVPVLVFFAYGATVALHAAISHADIAVPQKLDKALRWVIVTPDVHRIHHSQNMREGNSNFGTLFTIWDRLFGTYIDKPAQAPEALSMGLPASERPRDFSAFSLLMLPFRRRGDNAA